MKRILFIILTVIALVSLLAFSVSAADVDVKDYTISVVDSVATYYTSYSLGSFTYSPFNGSEQYFTGGSRNVYFSDLNDGLIFSTTYSLSYDDNSTMAKADLPFTFRLENVFLQTALQVGSGSSHFVGPISSYVIANIFYSDGSYDSVTGSVVRRDSSFYDFSFTFTPSKDVLKISLYYHSYLPLNSMPSGSYSYVSSNRYLTNITREYGEDLDNNSSILSIDQDTKQEFQLDEIINGSVDSTPPSDSGVVDDLDDIEGALRDESQVGLDQGLDMQQSALDVFIQYAAAFGVVKLIFELFSGIPFFTYLLYISVAVGIFAVLLNLSFDIRNSFKRNQRRSKSG